MKTTIENIVPPITDSEARRLFIKGKYIIYSIIPTYFFYCFSVYILGCLTTGFKSGYFVFFMPEEGHFLSKAMLILTLPINAVMASLLFSFGIIIPILVVLNGISSYKMFLYTYKGYKDDCFKPFAKYKMIAYTAIIQSINMWLLAMLLKTALIIIFYFVKSIPIG